MLHCLQLKALTFQIRSLSGCTNSSILFCTTWFAGTLYIRNRKAVSIMFQCSKVEIMCLCPFCCVFFYLTGAQCAQDELFRYSVVQCQQFCL